MAELVNYDNTDVEASLLASRVSPGLMNTDQVMKAASFQRFSNAENNLIIMIPIANMIYDKGVINIVSNNNGGPVHALILFDKGGSARTVYVFRESTNHIIEIKDKKVLNGYLQIIIGLNSYSVGLMISSDEFDVYRTTANTVG